MKFLDNVQVVNDTKQYNENNIFKGMIGTIIDAEIRNNCFNIIFIDERVKDKAFMQDENNFTKLKEDIVFPIKISDLKLIKNNHCSDKIILDSLPKNNPKWWCKVEEGYITNLIGEKKNKLPYNYNS